MIKGLKNSVKRSFAFFLAIVIFFCSMPSTIYGSVDDYPGMYVITITDVNGNPIDGANIVYTVNVGDSSSEEKSVDTDIDGTIGLDLSSYGENLTNGESVTIAYTASKEGYDTKSGDISVTTIDATDAVITLNEAEPSIQTALVSIIKNESAGGTVTIDELEADSKEVEVGTEVFIAITAAEGYQIAKILIGEEEEELTDLQTHTITRIVEVDMEVEVSFVRMHTIQVNYDSNQGTVTIDEAEIDSKGVGDGTEVSIVITAADGYQIAKILIGGEEETITDLHTHTITKVVESDMVVEVSFVRVYTVEINFDSNQGTVTTNPELTGGNLVVETETNLEITATPNTGYHVSEVIINGENESVSGENDSGFFKSLTADQNYEIAVTFALNIYSISMSNNENGSIFLDTNIVNHGGSVNGTIITEDGFTIVTATANGSDLQIRVIDEKTSEFTLSNVTSDVYVEIVYAAISEGDSSAYSFNKEDVIREDISNSAYIYAKDAIITFATEKNGIKIFDGEGTLIGGSESEQSVVISDTTTVDKIFLYYQAENEARIQWHEVVISPFTVVVDKLEPTITFENSGANQNGFNNTDAIITIDVAEEEEYSGIEKVEYYITFDGEATTPVTLYEDLSGSEFSDKKRVEVIVESEMYNSSGVVVTVKVLDKAGNETTEDIIVNICTDKPEVAISLTQDEDLQNDDAKEGVYSTERKAKIIVTDRDDVFDEALVLSGLCIMKDGQYIENDDIAIIWSQEGNVHTGELIFSESGFYEWELNYANKADLSDENVEISGENVWKFTIDKETPFDLSINYSQNVEDTIIESISFGFAQAEVTVTLTAIDLLTGISEFEYSLIMPEETQTLIIEENNILKEDVDNGIKATASFKLKPQFRGEISFVARDAAGHTENKTDTIVIVVDNEDPIIDVSYSDGIAEFYNNDQLVTIKITEENFFASDVKIMVIKDGSETGDIEVSPFISNGNEHTATIDVTEEGEYTLSISYADRSRNSAVPYMKNFVLDKTDPDIFPIIFDNNEVVNEKYYTSDRTATIKIKERNFDPNKVVLSITLTDINGNNIIGFDENKYINHVKKASNWTVDETDATIHKITLPAFGKEGNYRFTIDCEDKGTNTGTQEVVEFCIDKTEPMDVSIKKDNINILYTDTNKAHVFCEVGEVVEILAPCNVSGSKAVEYQVVGFRETYNQDENWLVYDDSTGIAITQEMVDKLAFVIYARVEDYAGHVVYKNTVGLTSDMAKPGIQPEDGTILEAYVPKTTLEIINAKEIYGKNDTVKINYEVVDPLFLGNISDSENGYCSGLKELKISIIENDTEKKLGFTILSDGTIANNTNAGIAASVENVIFDKTDSPMNGLTQKMSGEIAFNANLFNSNKVILRVEAIDNAGNASITSTTEGSIKCDIKEPSVKVTFDNNEDDEKNEGYFSKARVATVTVTERNFYESGIEITIKNAEGNVPGVSAWTKVSEGTGNGDDTKWSATINFESDGVYDLEIECRDKVGNVCNNVEYEGVAPQKFTIDKSIPVVEVTYDNNNSLNENYYKEIRVATIRVKDKHFDPDRVETIIVATDDGTTITSPVLSSWSEQSEDYVATITYSEDAYYTFDVKVKDMAGNEAETFTQQTFYIDRTAPEIEITGVEEVNSGTVAPVVTCIDTNYDENKFEILLAGVNRSNVAIEGSYSNIHNGRTYTFQNFAMNKEVDDIYTLTASMVDKAGNETTESVTFSVNRFGSIYILSEETKAINGTFSKTPTDVEITEINANELSDIRITMFKNNQTITLEERKDYDIDISGGNGQWYAYSYTIFKENFEDDGIYRILIHSEDKAGNVAENSLDTKSMEISFGIDDTKPTIVVTNLESDTTYAVDDLEVVLSVEDNLKLASLSVLLDGNEYVSWDEKALDEHVVEGKDFTFNISGDSTSAHDVRIICKDAAGNEMQEEVRNFYVTTNKMVGVLNNRPLIVGVVGGSAASIGSIVWMLLKRKKIIKIK